MKLVILHYHLRPGGIRRIIELATPYLIQESPRPVSEVVLATGQAASADWHRHFAQSLHIPAKIFLEPAFNYLSEQRGSPSRLTQHIRSALRAILEGSDSSNCLVWAHNLGVGRNLLLTREITAACQARDIPLVAHHHDWWFDNRWARWPEMRRFGFRTLAATAQALFPARSRILHTAINHTDASILSHHFGKNSLWLPNLSTPAPPSSPTRTRAARRWLLGKLGHRKAQVWILPCRTLRRKNIAEALLLTRWLRPEAWLVVTGGASSADETPYFHALETAAHHHHWRLRLGVLAEIESRKPSVEELLAASEAVLLTSIQEGFGLPYLEAAAAERPLLARRLPNIAPDLDRFGFRFPQAYDEILIPPGLFHWHKERARQTALYRTWRDTMPPLARRLTPHPLWLASEKPQPIPFSRLTLTAQIEVLAHPLTKSWAACAPLNPFLKKWRARASAGKLRASPWPQSAKRWLGGTEYAQRLFQGITTNRLPSRVSPTAVQADLIARKVSSVNLYPLLWSTRT